MRYRRGSPAWAGTPGRPRCLFRSLTAAVVLPAGAWSVGSCSDPTGSRNPSPVPVLWRAPLGTRDGGIEQPAVDAERLYAVGGGITAYRTADGSVAWQLGTGRMLYAPANVVVHGARVFAAESLAYAFDAATGRELWRFAPVTNASIGRSAADDRAFYFGTGTTERRVYALDAAGGRLLWSTEIGPEWEYRGWVRGVAVSGDTVYAAAEQYRARNGYQSSGWLVALDRATGRVLWRYVSGAGDDAYNFAAAPAVAGKLVIASGYKGNRVVAVDRFTGQEVWRWEGDRSWAGSRDTPAVVDNTVYMGSGDTYVYALDLATGAVRWRTKTAASVNALAVCGSAVFAQMDGVTVLDRASGRVRGTLYTGEEEFVTSGLAALPNRVFMLGTKAAYALGCS